MIGQSDDARVDASIEVFPLPVSKNHYKRYVLNCLRAAILLLRAKADVYHLHDPELLPLGILLRLIGKRVIFDSHEQYFEKMKSKALPKAIKSMVSSLWSLLEYIAARTLNHMIMADSYKFERFPKGKATVIANYAPLRIIECAKNKCSRNDSHFRIVYIGGISSDRGIEKTYEALTLLVDDEIELHLAGPISDEELRGRIENHKGVIYHGFLPWEEIGALLSKCDLGLILLQPIAAYLYYTGENIVKLYEYMALGLPVLLSNFPRLKAFIESLDCGIAVDPTSPRAIADAIKYLRDNPDVRKRMGENGRRAFLERFNWEIEEKKLLKVYETVLKGSKQKAVP